MKADILLQLRVKLTSMIQRYNGKTEESTTSTFDTMNALVEDIFEDITVHGQIVTERIKDVLTEAFSMTSENAELLLSEFSIYIVDCKFVMIPPTTITNESFDPVNSLNNFPKAKELNEKLWEIFDSWAAENNVSKTTQLVLTR